MKCPQCGKELEDLFCPSCGQRGENPHYDFIYHKKLPRAGKFRRVLILLVLLVAVAAGIAFAAQTWGGEAFRLCYMP
ncbi:MAG TPA: hypothetical protein DEP23_07745 [Ruminococcaceae bacterium]|nr:hypothetical protein [Oscillospiraceae bacterium]